MSSSSACSRTSAALIDLASGSRVTVKKEEPRWCWPKEELIEETKPDVKNIFQEPLLQWKELPNKGEIRFPRFTQEALESIQEDENELMCSEYSHPRFWKILEPFELSLLPTIERARGELDEGRMDDDFVDSDQEECVYEDRTFLRRQRPHKRRERSNRSYSSGKEYSGSRGCRTRSRLPPSYRSDRRRWRSRSPSQKRRRSSSRPPARGRRRLPSRSPTRSRLHSPSRSPSRSRRRSPSRSTSPTTYRPSVASPETHWKWSISPPEKFYPPVNRQRHR